VNGLLLKGMEKQLLYSQIEYARVKWYLISSGREGFIEEILAVTRNGFEKAAQIQEQLHQEGIIDLREVRELDE
jgi:hypothetical protein